MLPVLYLTWRTPALATLHARKHYSPIAFNAPHSLDRDLFWRLPHFFRIALLEAVPVYLDARSLMQYGKFTMMAARGNVWSVVWIGASKADVSGLPHEVRDILA
jgi:hypothetical protein